MSWKTFKSAKARTAEAKKLKAKGYKTLNGAVIKGVYHLYYAKKSSKKGTFESRWYPK